ncbi:MAG: flavodoxin domain-containing protein, partial [Armatimonadota bacterium]
MRTLVIYDTLHGNTAKIAQAIAEGLAGAGEVTVKKFTEAESQDLNSADFVVAGCPTHAWTISRPTKAFFRSLGRARFEGKAAAAFDTKFQKRLTGSAAGKISRAFEKLGFRIIREPESFFVRGMEG